MRTKSITRAEIRFNGSRVITLPLDSVGATGMWRPEPIRKLWAPLLRSLNAAQRRAWVKRAPMRERAIAAGVTALMKAKPPKPIRCPIPYRSPCECRHCGKEFFQVKSSSRSLFCSDRCASATRSSRQSRAVAEKRVAARADRTCAVCDAPLQAQRSTMRFCSPRCRLAGHRAAKRTSPP